MIEMMKSAIKDNTSEKVSIKRIITVILVLLLSVVIIGHVFFGKTIAEYVYNGLIEAVIWSLAFIGSEKFADVIPTMMNRRYPGKQIPDNAGGTLPEDGKI